MQILIIELFEYYDRKMYLKLSDKILPVIMCQE